MKFFRLDLLTLLISLFILNSCKNPTDVGLDVGNGDQLSGSMVLDSNVKLNTVREDSVIVSDLARAPIGYFNDPVFGVTEASLVTNINLPDQVAYTIPSGTMTIDSVVLGLKYAVNGFYGDSLNSTYKLDVYQLSEKPVNTKGYYNNKKWQHGTEVLGSKTFTVRLYDTVTVNDIVDNGPDTATRVLPQVRIRLAPSFVQKNLFTYGSQLESNTAFQNYARGLYVTLDKSGSTGTGGIMAFGRNDANLSSSYDTVYVYARFDDSGTIDTAVIGLPLTRRIAEVNHTYSTAVTEAMANTETSNSSVYLQGMGGLKAKIRFDGLNNLPSNIIINRAELIVQPKPGTAAPFAPLPKLTMYKLDVAKQKTYVEDMINTQTAFSDYFGGFFNVPTQGEYKFLLTNYIQNLVSGKTKDYGTYIAPANELLTSTADVSAAFTPLARTILAGKDSPYRVRLKIIYTNIK